MLRRAFSSSSLAPAAVAANLLSNSSGCNTSAVPHLPAARPFSHQNFSKLVADDKGTNLRPIAIPVTSTAVRFCSTAQTLNNKKEQQSIVLQRAFAQVLGLPESWKKQHNGNNDINNHSSMEGVVFDTHTGHIREIVLKGHKLSGGVDWAAIGELDHLEKLDLFACGITSAAATTTTTTTTASGSRVSNTETLPQHSSSSSSSSPSLPSAALSFPASLRVLILSLNKELRLDVEQLLEACRQLQVLELDFVNLEETREEFDLIAALPPQLQKCQLSHCKLKLSHLSLDKIKPALQSLSLASNQIENKSSSVTGTTNAKSNESDDENNELLPNLTVLGLHHNQLSSLSLLLNTLLPRARNLRQLFLNDNIFSGPVSPLLTACAQHLTTLTHLDISNCRFSGAAALSLQKRLDMKALVHFHCDGNDFAAGADGHCHHEDPRQALLAAFRCSNLPDSWKMSNDLCNWYGITLSDGGGGDEVVKIILNKRAMDERQGVTPPLPPGNALLRGSVRFDHLPRTLTHLDLSEQQHLTGDFVPRFLPPTLQSLCCTGTRMTNRVAKMDKSVLDLLHTPLPSSSASTTKSAVAAISASSSSDELAAASDSGSSNFCYDFFSDLRHLPQLEDLLISNMDLHGEMKLECLPPRLLRFYCSVNSLNCDNFHEKMKLLPRTLTALGLSYNSVLNGSTSAALPFDDLPRQLEILDLSSCGLSGSLANFSKMPPNLTSCRLDNNNFTVDDFAFLSHLPETLTEISLAGNLLGWKLPVAAASAVAAAAAPQSDAVAVVPAEGSDSVANSSSSSSGGGEHLQHTLDLTRLSSSLVSLNLSANQLHLPLPDLSQLPSQLQLLILSNNNFYSTAPVLDLSHLPHTLVHVDISMNVGLTGEINLSGIRPLLHTLNIVNCSFTSCKPDVGSPALRFLKAFMFSGNPFSVLQQQQQQQQQATNEEEKQQQGGGRSQKSSLDAKGSERLLAIDDGNSGSIATNDGANNNAPFDLDLLPHQILEAFAEVQGLPASWNVNNPLDSWQGVQFYPASVQPAGDGGIPDLNDDGGTNSGSSSVVTMSQQQKMFGKSNHEKIANVPSMRRRFSLMAIAAQLFGLPSNTAGPTDEAEQVVAMRNELKRRAMNQCPVAYLNISLFGLSGRIDFEKLAKLPLTNLSIEQSPSLKGDVTPLFQSQAAASSSSQGLCHLQTLNLHGCAALTGELDLHGLPESCISCYVVNSPRIRLKARDSDGAIIDFAALPRKLLSLILADCSGVNGKVLFESWPPRMSALMITGGSIEGSMCATRHLPRSLGKFVITGQQPRLKGSVDFLELPPHMTMLQIAGTGLTSKDLAEALAQTDSSKSNLQLMQYLYLENGHWFPSGVEKLDLSHLGTACPSLVGLSLANCRLYDVEFGTTRMPPHLSTIYLQFNPWRVAAPSRPSKDQAPSLESYFA